MRLGDVEAAERLTGNAFYQLDVASQPANLPARTRRSAERSDAWRERCCHLIEYDADGCWVAEDGTGLLGVATSLRRETLWVLSSFAVRDGAQGAGVGRTLLDAALTYSQGCVRGMIRSAQDPRAVRRYHRAGFTIYPQMLVRGDVARSRLPVVEHVRDGSLADVELLDSVDRHTRGAAHGVDHELMTHRYALRVIDDTTGSGYAYVPRTAARTCLRLRTGVQRAGCCGMHWPQPPPAPRSRSPGSLASRTGLSTSRSRQDSAFTSRAIWRCAS